MGAAAAGLDRRVAEPEAVDVKVFDPPKDCCACLCKRELNAARPALPNRDEVAPPCPAAIMSCIATFGGA